MLILSSASRILTGLAFGGALFAACSSDSTPIPPYSDAGTGGSTNEGGGGGAPHFGGANSADGPCDVPMTKGGYCVLGNRILKADASEALFRGINRPSLEWDPEGVNLSPNDYAEMAKWGMNVVRIPLNQAYWLRDEQGYHDRVQQNVTWANDAGLHVILDLHRAPLPDAEENEQQDMTNEGSLTFWREVAGVYKVNPNVSFELYNEPHNIGWELWQSGGTHPDGWTVVGMQQLLDVIREEGAHNLVLIGGLDWAYDLRGVGQHPIVGHNLVYVTHLYPYGTKMPEDWQGSWLFLQSEVPLFISEFGPQAGVDSPVDLSYVYAILSTARDYKLHYTAWAWFDFGTNQFLEEGWTSEPPDYPVTAYGQLMKDEFATY